LTGFSNKRSRCVTLLTHEEVAQPQACPDARGVDHSVAQCPEILRLCGESCRGGRKLGFGGRSGRRSDVARGARRRADLVRLFRLVYHGWPLPPNIAIYGWRDKGRLDARKRRAVTLASSVCLINSGLCRSPRSRSASSPPSQAPARTRLLSRTPTPPDHPHEQSVSFIDKNRAKIGTDSGRRLRSISCNLHGCLQSGWVSKLTLPKRRSLSTLLIGSHLAVGDVAAGQDAVPHRREETASYPAGRDRQPTRPLAGAAPFAGFATSVGLLLPSRIPRHSFILFDARLASRLPRSRYPPHLATQRGLYPISSPESHFSRILIGE